MSVSTLCGSSRSARGGFTVVELTVAMTVLAALLMFIVPAMGMLGAQQRRERERWTARAMADSLLARQAASAWSQPVDRDIPLSLTPIAASNLPDARVVLRIAAVPAPAGTESRRLSVAVHWSETPPTQESFQLTTWVFRPRETTKNKDAKP